MIKKYLLLFLFCFSGTLLFAQLRDPLGLTLYFSGEFNTRTFSTQYADFTSYTKPGHAISAGVRFPSWKRFYLQPGLHYVVNKNNFSHSYLSDPESSLSVSGLRIPMLVGFNFFEPYSNLTKQFYYNVQLFTGPAFTYILKVKHSDMKDASYLITDKQYHDVEWAWQVGAGFQFSLLFINLGIQKGLTYTFTGNSNAKSNQFFVNTGLLIPIRGIPHVKRYSTPSE